MALQSTRRAGSPTCQPRLQQRFRLCHRCDERRAEEGDGIAVCDRHGIPSAVAVDPTGKFAYVGNDGSNNISAYAIDANTGALTPVTGSPFSAGLNPTR